VLRESAPDDIEREFADARYGDFKKAVAATVTEHLLPIGDRYRELQGDQSYLEGVLADGAEKARAIASGTLADVRRAMGVGPPD
jgi:tryptophanyl-tRNA synthetase